MNTQIKSVLCKSIVVCLSLLSISYSHAGLFVKPGISYGLGEFKTTYVSSTNNSTFRGGTNSIELSLPFGYALGFLGIGLDYTLSSSTFEVIDNPTTAADNDLKSSSVKRLSIGPLLTLSFGGLGVYFSYYLKNRMTFSPNFLSDDKDFWLSGSAFKLCVGYKLINFLPISFELSYLLTSLRERSENGVTTNLPGTIYGTNHGKFEYSELFFGISVPIGL